MQDPIHLEAIDNDTVSETLAKSTISEGINNNRFAVFKLREIPCKKLHLECCDTSKILANAPR